MFINCDLINLASLLIALASSALSLVALVYTIRTYLLKSGLDIRGAWVLRSSISVSNHYVSNLTLQNNKDRAVVIFYIYLKIGHAYYLELADHSENPLIIQPFEAYQANYEPLIYYGVNMKRIQLNHLFEDRKVRKRIVLGTSQGRYTVRESVRKWSVLDLFFKNFATAIITPYRYEYKGVNYGDKTHFLVILKFPKEERMLPLLEDSYEQKFYKDIGFNKDNLKSEKTIREIFLKARRRKLIKFDDIEIINFRSLWKDTYFESTDKEIEGRDSGFLRYYLLGRFYTWRENKELKNKNARNARKRM